MVWVVAVTLVLMSEAESLPLPEPAEAMMETPAGARVPGQQEVAGLSESERAMLAFEREWWNNPASKESLVKQRFGMTNTQYHQVLNKLIDTPAALAADPMLVKRLQRRRSLRRRSV